MLIISVTVSQIYSTIPWPKLTRSNFKMDFSGKSLKHNIGVEVSGKVGVLYITERRGQRWWKSRNMMCILSMTLLDDRTNFFLLIFFTFLAWTMILIKMLEGPRSTQGKTMRPITPFSRTFPTFLFHQILLLLFMSVWFCLLTITL